MRKTKVDPVIPDPSLIRGEDDALDQSIALNRIVLMLLQQQREANKRMFISLIAAILLCAFSITGFLWYESQWEYTATMITQETDGDSDIVNGNQYNDSATHNEGGKAE